MDSVDYLNFDYFNMSIIFSVFLSGSKLQTLILYRFDLIFNSSSYYLKHFIDTFFKVGPNRSSFIYYDPFYRTYKYTMTQINFLPPPGFEPGSLGTVSR